MRSTRPPLLAALALCLAAAACAYRPIRPPAGAEKWPAVVVDTLPGLRAVEAPLNVDYMLSDRAKREDSTIHRIPLGKEMVVEFESTSPVGLLTAGAIPDARQYAAYCTDSSKVLLVVSLINFGYRPCRIYSRLWQYDLVDDIDCTMMGVFKSKLPCQ